MTLVKVDSSPVPFRTSLSVLVLWNSTASLAKPASFSDTKLSGTLEFLFSQQTALNHRNYENQMMETKGNTYM